MNVRGGIRRLTAELGWFGSNVALAVVCVYLAEIVFGLGRFMLGVPAGGGGNAFVEALGWATAGAYYLLLFSPLAAFYLVPYRLAVWLFGRPRLMAILTTALILGVLWVMSTQPDLGGSFGFALALGAYTVIVRAPGQDLGTLPGPARAAVAGIVLSMVWLLGSFAAMAWAGLKAARGQWMEAGVLAVTATLAPGLLLFFDLFRDYVPDLNYIVTGLLLAGTAFGLALVAGAFVRMRLRPA